MKKQNPDMTPIKSLTLADIEAYLAAAKEGGADPNTPVFLAAGKPGAEQLLQPLRLITNWPVRYYPSGGAACVPPSQHDPEAVAACIFSLSAEDPGGAVGFRFKYPSNGLYIVPAGKTAEFEAGRHESFDYLVPPVFFASWLEVALYIARDEADKTIPEVTQIVAFGDDANGFTDTARRKTYDLNRVGGASVAMYKIRREFGPIWFPKRHPEDLSQEPA